MAYDTSTFAPKAAAEARKAEMEATMCQSFGGWKDMNRHVKKGENAACN
ncbi:hypothetical protein [Butyrivibrio sp. FC2001]|nr:hypothetical protein [Butyrivibrio sp. FC2001]